MTPSNDGAEIEVVVGSNSRMGESRAFESFIEEKLYERFAVDNQLLHSSAINALFD